MDDVNTKRRYHSPRRQAQSLATRAAIIDSARRMFAEQGYAAISMNALAQDAEVAVQTIYSTFGSKRGILIALLDTIEEQAELSQHMADLAAATDPREQLRHITRFHQELFERGADVIQTALAAGNTDADLAEPAHEGNRRRRATAEQLIHGWAAAGVLRPNLGAEKAVDILWAMTSEEQYLLLVIGCGWTSDDYEAWLFTTLAFLLFGDRVDSHTIS